MDICSYSGMIVLIETVGEQVIHRELRRRVRTNQTGGSTC